MAPERRSLLSLALASPSATRMISDDRQTISVCSLIGTSSVDVPLQRLRGRTVLLATRKQFPTVLALLDLDGIAGQVLLATPDLHAQLSHIIAEASVDLMITDGDTAVLCDQLKICRERVPLPSDLGPRNVDTKWILFTSGTTGRPKMVVHTRRSLVGPVSDGIAPSGAVWSTFYDVRRYGGLQIMLRALVGGGSLVLSDADEAPVAFLRRVASTRVTHISGTPSHWRKALMLGADAIIAPAYVRLSGEVADQPILDSLRRAFPDAGIGHAFASTEAGVAFDVRDGLAGFPASYLSSSDVEMRIIDGTLRIRSARTASGYLGQALPNTDGFIDTGDLVEQHGDRIMFNGRREGVINVGGQKVFPEEVEAVLGRHPGVRMVRVWPRKNPITGAVVAADIVVGREANNDFEALRHELVALCQASLAPHKVPVTWRQVAMIEVTASGKVRRG